MTKGKRYICIKEIKSLANMSQTVVPGAKMAILCLGKFWQDFNSYNNPVEYSACVL